ncbi:MAG: cadmium-translocating P-type ATPase [Sphingobacteriaceae bacterium]|nr:cadmium-translocating P-type ATPase [Cytophagaceae bacterium]
MAKKSLNGPAASNAAPTEKLSVTGFTQQANQAASPYESTEVNAEDDGHDHATNGAAEAQKSILKSNWALWLSLVLLMGFLALTYLFKISVSRPVELGWMAVAYLLAGYKTIYTAWRKVLLRNFFNEFTLMTVATLGAFYIGEYAECVAVMLFYGIGEVFQDLAVNRSKRSIKALLDVRPDTVHVVRGEKTAQVFPASVQVGETIRVRPGEKVALDSEMLSDRAAFNTAALTGESQPDTKQRGEPVLAGMIVLNQPADLRVTALFNDSKLSRILDMVQSATARKAPTQLLINRLAAVYTPAVFGLALLITLVPALFVDEYSFNQWVYRGMVFLVIACPCALTVSIPLGYFGGIGLASRHGILVKGSNFLDVLTGIDTLVTDKTGTMTKGVFKVQTVETVLEKAEFIRLAASLEQISTHPVAKAVVEYASEAGLVQPTDVEEIAGHGLKGRVDGKRVLCGNLKLLKKEGVTYPPELEAVVETIVVVAVESQYAGYLTIADEVKEDAAQAVADLKKMGVKTVMLSGDKDAVTQAVAQKLGITEAYGDLLPEGKVQKVEELKGKGARLAFVGDGVNDAPVVALADVGIAMGGLGSDATIETADVVIQNDQPSRLVSAIRIGKITKSVVWQNISLAMGVKLIVMALGAGGIATLWEAVFADVGVALLAILNAYRIQGKKV